MNSARRLATLAAVFTLSTGASQAVVLFDGISDVTALTGTGSVPRTFMGEAVSLDAGGFSAALQSISSIEVAAGNFGPAITNQPLRLNLWLWQSYNPAAVSPAGVFGDQVGTPGTPTSVSDFGAVTMNTNTALFGTVTFTTPLSIAPVSGTTIGITLNWQVDQGAGFVDLPGLSSILHINVPPTVGANVTGTAPNFGYYRNASNETNGNFLSTSQRQIGANSGLYLRINGPDPIPEPTTTVLGAVFGLALLGRRSRR